MYRYSIACTLKLSQASDYSSTSLSNVVGDRWESSAVKCDFSNIINYFIVVHLLNIYRIGIRTDLVLRGGIKFVVQLRMSPSIRLY